MAIPLLPPVEISGSSASVAGNWMCTQKEVKRLSRDYLPPQRFRPGVVLALTNGPMYLTIDPFFQTMKLKLGVILPWEFPLDGSTRKYLAMADVNGFSTFRCTSRGDGEVSFVWQAPEQDANFVTAKLGAHPQQLIIDLKYGDREIQLHAMRAPADTHRFARKLRQGSKRAAVVTGSIRTLQKFQTVRERIGGAFLLERLCHGSDKCSEPMGLAELARTARTRFFC